MVYYRILLHHTFCKFDDDDRWDTKQKQTDNDIV